MTPARNREWTAATITHELSARIVSGGESVSLRRELIEYGLLQREGDGSAYWRPLYTISQLQQWIKGLPRKVV